VQACTPILDETVRHARRLVRTVGTLLLVVALLFVSVRVVRYAFSTPPTFHYYGTVETRFGTAGVFCGGETGPRCGDGTTVELSNCTAEVRAYFTNDTGVPEVAGAFSYSDVRARELLGKRPPSGDMWAFGCGNTAMIRGGLAKLQSL
jgi:hypothetical protein